MSRSASILAWAAPVGVLLSLSACQAPSPSTGDAKADAAIEQACRQRANEMYDRRNRAEIYAPIYGGGSPLSGTYTDVGINRDLSGRFAFESMVRDCIRTANISAEKPVAPSPATPATTPRPAGTALPPPGLGTRR